MNYCINPRCSSRLNDDSASVCACCGTELLIDGRFLLKRSLFDLDRIHPHDIYEAVDETCSNPQNSNSNKIIKVLKVSDELHLKLFQREAEILKSITHEGIPMIDIEDDFTIDVKGPELHCIALPKIDGLTLDDWVKQNGRISQEQAIAWFRQLTEILDAIHQSGFFHRDIKPSNIIVRPDKSLVLIDFGSAREVTDTFLAKIAQGQSMGLTQVGTLGYSPPEQTFGVAVPQSDFYALGYTMIYALTGKQLHELPRDPKTQHLRWDKAMPHVSRPLVQFLKELVEPSVALRPKNTQAILEFLEQSLPAKIKWSRRWQSKAFRYSSFVIGSVAIIGLLNYGRLRLSEYYYSSGLDLANQGDYITARQNFNLSIWLHEDEPAYTALARMCAHIGQADCARTNYEAAIQVNPQNESPWYNLATYYEDVNDLNAAQKTYQRALALKKDDPSTLNNLARLFILSGKYTQAKKSLEQAERALASHAGQESLLMLGTIYKNQGWMLYKQREYTKAKEMLSKAINSNPNLVSSYCLLAQVNEKMNQPASENWAKCVFPEENNVIAQDEALPEVSVWRHIRFNLSDKVKK